MSLPVVVSHTNRAPEYIGLTDPMEYTANGEVREYSIADFFSDPDGDTFTYTVTVSSGAVAQVFTSANKFLVKPAAVGETSITFTATDIYNAQSTKTIMVNVTAVLGIEDNDVNFSLTVYPNPSKGRTFIHVEGEIRREYHVRVFNSMGSILLSKDMIMQNEDAELDLGKLHKGIYFIEITDKEGRSTRRVVKE
jgi:hypothetical protein